MPTELLPCPFCSTDSLSEPLVDIGLNPNETRTIWVVWCPGCCAQVRARSRAVAEERWQSRTEDAEARSVGVELALGDVSRWLDAAGVPPAPPGLHGATEQVAARISALRLLPRHVPLSAEDLATVIGPGARVDP